MKPRQLPLVLIAAVARNGIIGRDGGLPWRLPGDLTHFREATMGQPVILGRKTFEAIGRPLPGRHLVVLSRDPNFHRAGVEVAATFPEALAKAQATGLQEKSDVVMVAGGGSVYASAIDQADALLITEVSLEPPGDTRFPPIDKAEWRVLERGPERRLPGDEAAHALVRYGRSHAPGAFDPAARPH